MIEVLTHTFSVSGFIWLGFTLLIYRVGLLVNHWFRGHPVSHPLIFTALTVGLAVWLSNTAVEHYQRSAGLLHWLLGPATVALALPIYRQWQRLRTYGWRLPVSIVIGGVIAPILAWVVLWLSDAPLAMQITMLSKSITTPLAMGASEHIGGVPALAAVFVIITGIVGAIGSVAVFSFFKVTDVQAQGVALGTVAHAVGTAKALQMGDDVAAMATLGLCVNGVFTALILPLLFSVLPPVV